jgi:Fe(3+) dicitrate transport protein
MNDSGVSRTLLTAALLVGLPGVSAAQQATMSGRVVEVESRAPVGGVTVRVAGEDVTAVTGWDGRYRLVGVPSGTQVVEAVSPGFRSAQRVVSVDPGDEVRVDFVLGRAELRAPQVDVIGTAPDALERIPGSAAVVSRRELRERVPLSGSEVLRSVPGVHVQEEEGIGLRANIGIRGLDPDRSRTVLVLEDGAPISLAPYGEPEMYYTPPIDRMDRVEVVKGSGSILFGPQTIGGVINYVTPAPPMRPTASLDVRGGSGSLLHVEGRYGGTWGNVGTLVGMLRKQADDLAGLFYTITDVTGKVVFSMGETSEVGVKLSVYDEESNSTYVGLTEEMFRADARRHPSPDDRLWVRRYGASATHDLLLGSNALLRTTVYGHTVSRDWMRHDYVADPQRTSIAFRGTTGSRNRSFDVLGVEPRLQLNHRLAGVRGEFDAGVRVHLERAEDAHVLGASPGARTGVVRDLELRDGRAIAAYLQNRFELDGRFYLTPGVRLESFAFDRNILRQRVDGVPTDVDISSSDWLTEVIPGVGLSWVASDRLTVFAGAHRGFAPPRIKDAFVVRPGTGDQAELVSLQLDAERSLNAEVGLRAALGPTASFETTAFRLDFTNQIISPSLSAGSVAQAALVNQGETLHTGIESAISFDPGAVADLPFRLALDLRHTYVRATFSADRFMPTSAGDTVNVRGNRLPYAPEHLVGGGVTLDFPVGLLLRTDVVYTGDQFSDNFETTLSRPDGQVGTIPAHTVWNAAVALRLPRGAELFGTVKNVLDSTYIASRRPEGIKPGLPRTLSIGLRAGL